jgi:hypothetical protein
MELEIKTSIIDYLGATHGGVSILVGLTVANDYTFEAIYWIHPTADYILEAEADFLKLFGADDAQELPFINELVADIESILPDKNEIFEAFSGGAE